MNFEILFAEAAADPGAGTVLMWFGIIGAGLAGIYQRFSIAGVKIEKQKTDAAVEGCEKRCKDFTDRIWLQQEQIRSLEREKAKWEARCESLGWYDQNPRPSPPTTEIA